MSHTPGPWEAEQLEGRLDDWTGTRIVLRAKEAPGGICAIIGGLGALEEEDTARLIKAAPKMLKALRDIERHHVALNSDAGRGQERSTTLRMAREAIAEATEAPL